MAESPDWTVGQTIEEIRANAQTIGRLYAVYLVDGERVPWAICACGTCP